MYLEDERVELIKFYVFGHFLGILLTKLIEAKGFRFWLRLLVLLGLGLRF